MTGKWIGAYQNKRTRFDNLPFEAQPRFMANKLVASFYPDTLIDYDLVPMMLSVLSQLMMKGKIILENFKSIIKFEMTCDPLIVYIKNEKC